MSQRFVTLRALGACAGLLLAIIGMGLAFGGQGATAAPQSYPASPMLTPTATPSLPQYFQDVPPGNFYYAATAALYQQLVISGFPCGISPAGPCVPPSNRPYYLAGNNVTRGQMSFYVQNARTQPGIVMNDNFSNNNATEISLTSSSTNPALQITNDSISAPAISVSSPFVAAVSVGSGGAEAITASSTASGFAAIKGFALGNGPGIQGQGTTGSGLDGISDGGAGITALSVNASGGVFDTYAPASQWGVLVSDGGLSLAGSNASLRVVQNANIIGNLVVGGSKTGYVVDIMRNDSGGDLHPGEVVSASGKAAAAAQIGVIPVANATIAGKAYDTAVLGVVDQRWMPGDATAPANSKARDGSYDAETSVIHAGEYMSVVTLGSYQEVKVTASNGAIRAGDLLTTSDTAGVAMRVGDKDKLAAFGAVIGKALGNLDSGSGSIAVLVTLK